MTETTSSGGTRIGGVLGILGLVAAMSVGAIALSSNTPAGAEALERFDSCAELEAWDTEVQPPVLPLGEGGDDGGAPTTAVATDGEATSAGDGAGTGSGAAAPSPQSVGDADREESAGADLAATDEAAGGGGGTGGTNTVVEGVDEIDVIDRVGEDRLLISRNGVLALVDLAGRAVVAELAGIPYDARISVANDLVWIAGSVFDPMVRTEVRRVRIDGDALVEDGTWSTPGGLHDARRTGDTLHLVAVDYPTNNTAGYPFADGPVPCDQVWRPVSPPTEAGATLVASLPADGPLEPTAAAEVTGSAGTILVTDGAAYIATQTWSEDGTVTTGVHRFDLAGLTLTGSGLVPGSIAGPFAMNEHDGHLRVATNAGSSFGFPMPVDDIAVDRAVPETTAAEGGVASLAEVFVLDLDGDLDIVGQTGRFGHDGETIHGVRFVGDVAYVVTFLQTDPFWVIDLADPAAPVVVGELEIPGFSGYLHPIADGLVVGFGPDGNGQTSARLFDVADPQAPSVTDELTLGHDSTVAYDHHAFVGLGDAHFAVPFTDYPIYREDPTCASPDRVPVPLPEPLPESDPDTTTVPPDVATDSVGGVVEPFPGCAPEPIGGAIGAVELEVVDGRLVEVDRASVERSDAQAERVILGPDGTWLVLSWDRLIPTDGDADLVLPTA